MDFKDYVAQDNAVFFNVEEFGETHNINGTVIPCVLDEDVQKERSREPIELYHAANGVYIHSRAIVVRLSDLGERPVIGQHMRVDGELYLVANCSESKGLLEITLEANEA